MKSKGTTTPGETCSAIYISTFMPHSVVACTAVVSEVEAMEGSASSAEDRRVSRVEFKTMTENKNTTANDRVVMELKNGFFTMLTELVVLTL